MRFPYVSQKRKKGEIEGSKKVGVGTDILVSEGEGGAVGGG